MAYGANAGADRSQPAARRAGDAAEAIRRRDPPCETAARNGPPIARRRSRAALDDGDPGARRGLFITWSDSLARDLICFSHLRWNFVRQRPNHLMARAAKDRRVYYVEEPMPTDGSFAHLERRTEAGVTIVTPHLPASLETGDAQEVLAALMTDLVGTDEIRRPTLWYYTPMALPWSRHLGADVTVFDSMDDLTGFRGAPDGLGALEDELLARADIVFCGGASLHARMAHRHPNSHCFPSSVDLDHFRRARSSETEPSDQSAIAHPRIGYAGVIDERINLDLIAGVAARRPDWQLVLVGPIAKIAPEDVPVAPNIHQLGMKTYAELPDYLAGWDIGWMPFAHNDATRFISPTKTPEYLAAGLPVVSTSIHDVVEAYGSAGLVTIADSLDDTIAAIDAALDGAVPDVAHVDQVLARASWDSTWRAMDAIVRDLTTVRDLVALTPEIGTRSDRRPVTAPRAATPELRRSRVPAGRSRSEPAVTGPSGGRAPAGVGEGS